MGGGLAHTWMEQRVPWKSLLPNTLKTTWRPHIPSELQKTTTGDFLSHVLRTVQVHVEVCHSGLVDVVCQLQLSV